MYSLGGAFNSLIWLLLRKYPKLDTEEGKAVFNLSFDCDFERDIKVLPDVLGALKNHSLKASFACIGKWIERYPREHALIVRSGHEIVNHSYSHPDNEELNPYQRFNLLSRDEQKEEVLKCHRVCLGILDYEPIGFRTPHFARLHTPGLYDILSEIGYSYSSSTSAYLSPRAGLPYRVKNQILELPLTACPEHPRTIFDNWHCFTHPQAAHKYGDEFMSLFKRIIDKGISSRSYLNIYFDPFEIVQRKSLDSILSYLVEKNDELLVLTYRQVLQRWLE
jgi:peptidoglycan/xylan/chitin deacetylase (PgdA/CDA1 family)